MNRLQELALAKGKKLLIENYVISIDPNDVEIFEESRLIESANGAKFKARGVLKNVNISKYTENLNKRVYSKQLWENIKSKKMGEGSLCLMGHPDDDGNPKDIAGVWHNLEIGEKTPTADIYMVGDHGALMLEVVEAGGDVGFSTVGFGEIMEDGKTVDPSSYELARMGDWVLVPSQGVYANKENLTKNEESEQTTQESLFIEKFDTNNKRYISETNNEVLNMNKTQGNLRNQVKHEIKEAFKSDNKREALEDLREFKENLDTEAIDQHTKLDLAIYDLNKQVEAQEKELTESLAQNEITINELTENLDTITQAYNELAESYKKLESIIEKLGVDIDSEEVSNLKEKYEQAIKNVKLMENDIKQYDHDAKLRENEVNQLCENADVMQSDIDKLKEDRETLIKDRDYLIEDRMILESDRETLVEFAIKAITQIRAMEKCLVEEFNAEFTVFEDERIDSIMEASKKKEQDEEDPKDDDKKDDKPEDKPENDKDKDEMDEEVEEEAIEEGKAKKEQDDDEDEDEDKNDDKEDDDKDEMGESVDEPVVKKSPIEIYFESIKEENASVEDIKEEVLKAETLTEATKIVDTFINKSKDEDVFKVTVKKDGIKESASIKKGRSSWLGNRI